MTKTMEASPMMRRAAVALAAMVFTTATAFAQSSVSASLSSSPAVVQQTQDGAMSQDPMPQGMMTMEPDRRPATTTVDGDTGLWFVPTAEVLGPRQWSFSIYRKNLDYEQGFTDVSTFPFTFAVGLGERVELFTAIEAVRRIDRDTRPLFFDTADNDGGGVVNEYPHVREAWSGNDFGDIWVGAKINLLSQYE